jgi:hypothetical protein
MVGVTRDIGVLKSLDLLMGSTQVTNIIATVMVLKIKAFSEPFPISSHLCKSSDIAMGMAQWLAAIFEASWAVLLCESLPVVILVRKEALAEGFQTPAEKFVEHLETRVIRCFHSFR